MKKENSTEYKTFVKKYLPFIINPVRLRGQNSYFYYRLIILDYFLD